MKHPALVILTTQHILGNGIAMMSRVGKTSISKAGPKFVNSVSRVNNPAASRSGMTRHALLTRDSHLVLNFWLIMKQKKAPREPHLQELVCSEGQPTDFLRLVRTRPGNAAALQAVRWIHLPRGSCRFLDLLHVSFHQLQRDLLSDPGKLLC